MFHSGSTQMAQNLNRFGRSQFEENYVEAARLKVTVPTLEMYRDWYGDEQITVIDGHGLVHGCWPSYEFHIRKDVWGQKLNAIKQMQMAL